MKQGVAFEFAGMSFGPKPEGYEEFVLIQTPTYPRELVLYAQDCLGRRSHVKIEIAALTLSKPEEGILRGCLFDKISHALSCFKPLDALDILRAAQ